MFFLADGLSRARDVAIQLGVRLLDDHGGGSRRGGPSKL
jgi:hypothetical protein